MQYVLRKQELLRILPHEPSDKQIMRHVLQNPEPLWILQLELPIEPWMQHELLMLELLKTHQLGMQDEEAMPYVKMLADLGVQLDVWKVLP